MTDFSSPVYTRRLDYPVTQCAGTSVEGDGVRVAARPHPTHTINLTADTWVTLTAHPGHVRLVFHEGLARSHPFDVSPDVMGELGSHALWLADLARLPAEEL